MYNPIARLNDIRNEMLLRHKKDILDLYKEGKGLGEICREMCLDISSVLYILKKCRLYKKTLYNVYEEQTNRADHFKTEFILEDEEYYLEKFFPQASATYFSSSYYFFWKEKFKRTEAIKAKCNHSVRTITCSLCNKILKDASNIPIDNTITKKLEE